jgi:hypothetical protein
VKLADVVPATGAWPDGAAAVRREGRPDLVRRPDRRTFLGGAMALATGAGLATLGVFPRARAALASGPEGQYGYRYHRGTCPSYAASANCEPGCGPSPVYSDTCETSGTYEGWFKNNPSAGYRLRPGQCLSGYDAWEWRYAGACGRCSHEVSYRCHDGYKSSGGAWFNAICRHVNECDGRDPDAPVTHKPVGQVTHFDRPANAQLRIRGWAIDPDATDQAVPIRVRLDGRIVKRGPANLPSNDIPSLFHEYGRRHGFDFRIKHLHPGTHQIRVHAVSIGAGNTVELLRRRVVVRP